MTRYEWALKRIAAVHSEVLGGSHKAESSRILRGLLQSQSRLIAVSLLVPTYRSLTAIKRVAANLFYFSACEIVL